MADSTTATPADEPAANDNSMDAMRSALSLTDIDDGGDDMAVLQVLLGECIDTVVDRVRAADQSQFLGDKVDIDELKRTAETVGTQASGAAMRSRASRTGTNVHARPFKLLASPETTRKSPMKSAPRKKMLGQPSGPVSVGLAPHGPLGAPSTLGGSDTPAFVLQTAHTSVATVVSSSTSSAVGSTSDYFCTVCHKSAHCPVCNLSFSSEIQHEEHNKGRKHQMLVQQREEQGIVDLPPVERPFVCTVCRRNYYCQVCNKPFCSQMQMEDHLHGRKHKKLVAKLAAAGQLPPDFTNGISAPRGGSVVSSSSTSRSNGKAQNGGHGNAARGGRYGAPREPSTHYAFSLDSNGNRHYVYPDQGGKGYGSRSYRGGRSGRGRRGGHYGNTGYDSYYQGGGSGYAHRGNGRGGKRGSRGRGGRGGGSYYVPAHGTHRGGRGGGQSRGGRGGGGYQKMEYQPATLSPVQSSMIGLSPRGLAITPDTNGSVATTAANVASAPNGQNAHSPHEQHSPYASGLFYTSYPVVYPDVNSQLDPFSGVVEPHPEPPKPQSQPLLPSIPLTPPSFPLPPVMPVSPMAARRVAVMSPSAYGHFPTVTPEDMPAIDSNSAKPQDSHDSQPPAADTTHKNASTESKAAANTEQAKGDKSSSGAGDDTTKAVVVDKVL